MPPSPPPTLRKHWTCQVESCDAPHTARGLCDKHYQAWRKYGDPLASRKSKRKTCRIEGCNGKAHGHSLCTKHYLRWYTHGDAEYERPAYAECDVDGCDAAPRSPTSKWCEKHYGRLRRNGDPEALVEKRQATATYRAAHTRLVKDKGLAADRRCIDCGQDAHHWSYNHQDPDPLYSEGGQPYSLNGEYYEPRCRRCHKAFDAV